MSLRQILLANGFTDLGICPVCGGTGWLYSKIVGRYEAKIKVKLNKQPPGPVNPELDNGTAVLTFKNSKTFIKPGGADLQTVLDNQGLAQSIQA